MKEELIASHRRFNGLFAELRLELGSRDRGSATVALSRLRAELEVHFEQEEALYYPAIEGVRSDLSATLRGFAENHVRFSGQLDEVGTHLEEGRVEQAEELFEDFTQAFAGHELREEKLLHSLDPSLESAV